MKTHTYHLSRHGNRVEGESPCRFPRERVVHGNVRVFAVTVIDTHFCFFQLRRNQEEPCKTGHPLSIHSAGSKTHTHTHTLRFNFRLRNLLIYLFGPALPRQSANKMKSLSWAEDLLVGATWGSVVPPGRVQRDKMEVSLALSRVCSYRGYANGVCLPFHVPLTRTNQMKGMCYICRKPGRESDGGKGGSFVLLQPPPPTPYPQPPHPTDPYLRAV